MVGSFIISACAALLWEIAQIFLAGFRKLLSRRVNRQIPRTVTKYEECKAVIAGHTVPRGAKNLLTPFQSRAIPNERLAWAFGITNAFTTDDIEAKTRFVKEAKRLLRLQDAQWKEIREKQRDQLEYLNLSTSERFPMTSVVQCFSLRTALHVIFGVNMQDMEEKWVSCLADEINRLWSMSKGPKGRGFEHEDRIKEALSALLPDCDLKDRAKNPLGLILPAFETLWRVVLRTLLDVHFVASHRSAEWEQALVEFSKNPTTAQLQQQYATNEGTISAEAIVNEALRLYPPTRRVHRAFLFSMGGEVEVWKADIEACQRDPDMWGDKATEFIPGRWSEATDDQKRGILAFGSGGFTCPAKPEFGPRIIALTVGVLIEFLGGKWELEKRDEPGCCLIEGTNVDRDEFPPLHLVRK